MTAILVVDDDADIREFISVALGMQGYDVREARNGLDALDVLAGWRADAILLDLNMPIMDGPTFCSERRRHPDLAGIPLAVMSARFGTPTSDAPEAPKIVLRKPFLLDTLLRCVGDMAKP